MNIYGRIYLITNLINGMKYIGKTTKTLEQRFIKHCRDAAYPSRCNKTYLNNALAKYGFSNFKIEQIDVANSAQMLDLKESNHIQGYDTLYPNGYNLILRYGNLNIITDLIRQKCAAGGRKGWQNALKDPIKMAIRQNALLKAGRQASIKNKERTGLKVRKNTTSKYFGVSRKKNRQYVYWRVCWTENDRQKSNLFKNEIDAAKHYDENMIRLHGRKLPLNFP